MPKRKSPHFAGFFVTALQSSEVVLERYPVLTRTGDCRKIKTPDAVEETGVDHVLIGKVGCEGRNFPVLPVGLVGKPQIGHSPVATLIQATAFDCRIATYPQKGFRAPELALIVVGALTLYLLMRVLTGLI